MIAINSFEMRGLQRALPPEVRSLMTMLRETRNDVFEHSVHVAMVARRLARALCVPQDDIDVIVTAAFLHDVGKLVIPAAVLYKAGFHDPDERNIMRQHAYIGETMITPFLHLHDVAMVVGQHHERVDGLGYPRGLASDAIDHRARILSIADAATAMTEERSYQAAVSPGEAVGEIHRCADRHFDREAAEAMRAEFLSW